MDANFIVMAVMWFVFSSLGLYFAWFRSEQFRRFLRWNSELFGGNSSFGKAWLASKYYFWLMRFVATGLFILALITIILIIVDVTT